MRLIVCLFLVLAVTSPVIAQEALASAKPLTVKGPLSPEESLKHLVLGDPNLVIEIVAAEPEVIDPVAMQFDEHGRLWVVEMRDYPTGPKNAPPPMGGPEAKPLSRIKLLEDKDGDGRFETAHVFAENLLFATGIQPWDGGVIVTHSGEIVYLKDTDGDHKADVREVWFTGFSETNTQLRANHPTFGPDGWIYVANGLRGGNVIAVKKDWPVKAEGSGVRGQRSEKDKPQSPPHRVTPSPPQSISHDPANPVPVSLTGRDFKFDPLTGRYEAISGNGQFGMTFDAWGNRFVCDNRHPCRHVIFEEDFIRRCPHVAFPAVVNDVIPGEDKTRVHPLTSAWTTSNLHAGTFTAACGVCVYTGNWLPEGFPGCVFVCEPTGNLVHFEGLWPNGSTFLNLEQAEHYTGEFLQSRDEWFRPVDLQNGPDGALYVVDMYRAVIEHPEWVPDELKNRPDTWLGNDRGRIYRIRSKGGRPKRNLAISINELDESFNCENGWHRTTALRIAHQLCKQGQPINGLQPVRPEAICMALRSDNLRTSLPRGLLERSLLHKSIQVQAEGLRQCAREWEMISEPDSNDLYHKMLMTFLRYGAGFQAVQEWPRLKSSGDPDDLRALAEFVSANLDDRWTRIATVAVVKEQAFGVLVEVLELLPSTLRHRDAEKLAALAELIGELGEQVALHQPEKADEVVSWLNFVRTADNEELSEEAKRDLLPVVLAGLKGFSKGLARRGKSLRDSTDVVVLHRITGSASVEINWKDAKAENRLAAVQILRFSEFESSKPILSRTAETSPDQALRAAAIETFASFHRPEVTIWLLDRYPAETPAIRRAILSALLASKERQLALLGAIADGKIAATEIDPVRAKQLTDAKDEGVREKARQVLAAAAPASRQEVLAAYQPALTLKADPQRGREVFQKNCVTCHRVGDLGVNVAPDISDTRTKKPEQLLLDILDPNRAIDANYFSYAVVTKDGRTESGVIASESSNSITLKQPEGKVLTLLRSDIEDLRNTGLSLMPVGVEKNITQQQMADLIFWLKNWRYLDGKVPATSLGGK